jgi:hypothetical protein
MNTEDTPAPEISQPQPCDETATPPPQPERDAEGSPQETEKPATTRFDRRAKAAADALRTILRDFCLERLGAEPEAALHQSVRLNLDFSIGGDWELNFKPSLYEQLNEQFEDLGVRTGIFLPGAAYNYFDETSEAPECRPPSPLSVFDQYDSKGIPQWCDLMQALLKAGDERTAQLYEKPPRILARMLYGRDLNREQLHTYGRSSRTYAILGQVIAGYFQLPAQAAIQNDRRLAVTLQVVETRETDRQFGLKLNLLSALTPQEISDLFAHKWEPGLQRACTLAQRDIEKLETQARAIRRSGSRKKAGELMRQVPAILRRLAASLERNERQTGRRTTHARQRREEHRPVHKALDDARTVKTDRFFFDLKHESWVVVGSAGRTHAFNAEGRHITSFSIKSDAIAHRIRTQRWRLATPEEFNAFQQQLERGQVHPAL